MTGAGSRRAEKLRWSERLGYGVGDFGFNLYWTTLTSFLAAFYTDVLGLAVTAAGTMIFVTKLAVAAVDPAIGAWADRTSTRWGKFRPFLLCLGAPLAVAVALAFTAPALDARGKLLWASSTYALMMLLYSALNTPYSALSGVMTSSSQERTTLVSIRFVFAFIGAFVVNRSTLPLVELLGGGPGQASEARGWQLVLCLYGVLATLTFLVTFATARERVAPQRAQSAHPLRDVRDLLQSPPWVVLFVLALVLMFATTLRSGSAYYYFKYYVGRPELVSSYLGWQAALYAGGAVAAPFLTRFVDKARLLVLLMGLVGGLLVVQAFVPPEMVWATFALNVPISLALGTKSPLTWSMYADCADENEWRTGRRATAMTFAAATFSQKIGVALGSAGLLWLLGLLGYAANEVQSGASLSGIVVLHTAVPGVLALFAVLVAGRYGLGRAELASIQLELERRRADG